VFILGNPCKANLQEKFLPAYTNKLLNKDANFYHNYQHCHTVNCRKVRGSQLFPSDALVARLLLPVLVKLPGQITELARSSLTK
jgi:hypothetical protein